MMPPQIRRLPDRIMPMRYRHPSPTPARAHDYRRLLAGAAKRVASWAKVNHSLSINSSPYSVDPSHLAKLPTLRPSQPALLATSRAYRVPSASHSPKLAIDQRKHRNDHRKGGDDGVPGIALRHERPVDAKKHAIDRSKQAIDRSAEPTDRSMSRALRFKRTIDRFQSSLAAGGTTIGAAGAFGSSSSSFCDARSARSF